MGKKKKKTSKNIHRIVKSDGMVSWKRMAPKIQLGTQVIK